MGNSYSRTPSAASAGGRSGVSARLRLYVIRGLIAISWAVGFATVLDFLVNGTIIRLFVHHLSMQSTCSLIFAMSPAGPDDGCSSSLSELTLSLRSPWRQPGTSMWPPYRFWSQRCTGAAPEMDGLRSVLRHPGGPVVLAPA